MKKWLWVVFAAATLTLLGIIAKNVYELTAGLSDVDPSLQQATLANGISALPIWILATVLCGALSIALFVRARRDARS